MGQFNITGPDGKKYKVTGDTAEGALAALKKHLGDTGENPDGTFGQPPEGMRPDPQTGAMVNDQMMQNRVDGAAKPDIGPYDPTQSMGGFASNLRQVFGHALDFGSMGVLGDEAGALASTALATIPNKIDAAIGDDPNNDAPFMDRYKANLAQGQENAQAFDAAHPKLKYAAYADGLGLVPLGAAFKGIGMAGTGGANILRALGVLGPAAIKAAPVAGRATTIGARAVQAGTAAAKNATVGGMAGGVYGFMTGEGLDDRMKKARDNAVFGALATVGVGGGLDAIGAFFRSRAGKAAIQAFVDAKPSAEQLHALGSSMYEALRKSGITMDQQKYQQWFNTAITRAKADMDKANPLNTNPEALKVISRLEGNIDNPPAFVQNIDPRIAPVPGPAPRDVPIGKLLDDRASVSGALSSLSSPNDKRVVGSLLQSLDAGIATLGKEAKAAQQVWKRFRQSEEFERVVDLIGAGSEAATLRKNFRAWANSEKRTAGMTSDQVAVMREIAKPDGTPGFWAEVGKGFAKAAGTVAGAVVGHNVWPNFGMATGAYAGNRAVADILSGAKRLGNRVSDAALPARVKVLQAMVATGKTPTGQALPSEALQKIKGMLLQLEAPAHEAFQ